MIDPYNITEEIAIYSKQFRDLIHLLILQYNLKSPLSSYALSRSPYSRPRAEISTLSTVITKNCDCQIWIRVDEMTDIAGLTLSKRPVRNFCKCDVNTFHRFNQQRHTADGVTTQENIREVYCQMVAKLYQVRINGDNEIRLTISR